MGGQILEHEGKTIFNAGAAEGRWEANLDTARRLREIGMNDNDIHRATNISLDNLQLLWSFTCNV